MPGNAADHRLQTAASEPLASRVNPGDQLGHYRIDGVVSESKTSKILQATDLRDRRKVAIKVPQPAVERDPNFAGWFRREKEIGERLDHPGIIKVIPDAEAAEGCIVMEWFEGKPLRAILNEQKSLPPDRAIRVTVKICEALEYMHSNGVLHRDLQPENILVGVDDEVKLVDFGGAAKTQARRLTFTKVAQLTGTSDYVSPEELLGKQGSARSDLFALGLILYEMLTGQRAFPQSDPYYRLSHYPVPPRELNAAISPQLQEVIYRALERNPQNRYASAHEFAQDLTHLDQVGVADRVELKEWKKGRPQRKALYYLGIALIPIAIFALLFYLARH